MIDGRDAQAAIQASPKLARKDHTLCQLTRLLGAFRGREHQRIATPKQDSLNANLMETSFMNC
jgi:hypothetical protein